MSLNPDIKEKILNSPFQTPKERLELLQEIIDAYIIGFRNAKEATQLGFYGADALKVVYSQSIVCITMIEGFIKEYLLKEFWSE